jgi:hypothetical protein
VTRADAPVTAVCTYIGDSVRAKRLTLDEGDLDEFRARALPVGAAVLP